MSNKFLSVRHLALGVLALGAILTSAMPITASAQVAGTTIPAQATHLRGSASAQVTLEEWVDYKSPYVVRLAPTISQLITNYNGKVNLVVKHLPLTAIYPLASKAAEATECASAQGDTYFWKLHDWLLGSNTATDWNLDTIKLYMAGFSSDSFSTARFNQCLDNGEQANTVANYLKEGTNKGINGVPTTYVIRNSDKVSEMVSGAVGYDTLKAAIEKLLGATNQGLTVTVALAPSTPAAGNIMAGATNVTLASVSLAVSGGVGYLNGIHVGSDSSNASGVFTNIKLMDGATQLGSTVSSLTWNGSYYYAWIYPSPVLTLTGGTTKTLNVVADISTTAAGLVRLGVAGLNFDYPGAVAWGMPVYGNTMTIVPTTTKSSIVITSPSGGEQWQVGGTYNINWSASSDSANSLRYISGVYMPSGGTMGIEFALKTLGQQGSYTWTIPSTWPTGQWKIRVGVQPEGTGTYVDSKEFSVVAVVTNKPPVITVGAGPTNLNVNQTGTWTLKAYDPDGTYLSYGVDWGEGTAFNSQSKSMAPSPSTTQATTFDHTYATAGTYKIVFTASDDKGASTQASTTVVVGDVTTLNRAPVLGPMVVPAEVRIGQSVNFTLNASDPDGDPIGWDVSWGDGRGDGVECSAQRNPFYISHAWTATGSYLVKVRANDCRGGVADTSFTVNVGGLVANNPPKIVGGSTLPSQIEAGDKVYLSWQATDPDGDALSWSVNWGDGSGATSGICSDSLCTKYASAHSWDAAGTYLVTVKVTDNKGGFDRSELKVPVGKVSPPYVGGIKAPKSGNYALKMNWFNASARTFIFLPQAAVGLTSAASAGATSIMVTQNPAPTTGRYFIYDKTNNSIEELSISGGASGGCDPKSSNCPALTTLQLSSPLLGSYTTEAKVAPLVALYQGYYPPVGGAVNLGPFAEGQEMVVGHISQWWGKLFGPVTTSDPDYYVIEQSTGKEPTIFSLSFDDGLHFNWSGRGVRSGYNDGNFDVYYTGEAVTMPSPVTPIPTPVPQPAQPTQPGQPTPVLTTPVIVNEANGILEGRVEDVSPEVKIEQAKVLLQRADTILKKIKALKAELDELTPAIAAVRDFVALGTNSTEKLGVNERANVIQSYQLAFAKVPEKTNDWQDVIKIANGQAPDQRNAQREIKAEAAFKKIYRRTPQREAKPADDKAVEMIAYGIQPDTRVLAKEKAAIKTFTTTFRKNPTTTEDWNTVKAIAYSGAKK